MLGEVLSGRVLNKRQLGQIGDSIVQFFYVFTDFLLFLLIMEKGV